MSKGNSPVVLVVLDGWGWRTETDGNAIAQAPTPVWDRIVERQPLTLLDASGRAVGLPTGQMGNSEVGHLNLGAGRIVPQDIVRISQSMEDGSFYQIPELVSLCRNVRDRDGTLHLIGLLGDGGVHGHHDHLVGALEMAKRHDVPRVALHMFLDGRDTAPTSAANFMREAVSAAERASAGGHTNAAVASAVGRYFVMDRDRRWERTRLGYDAMVHGTGTPVDDPVAGIESAYDAGETDEFIKPFVVHRDGQPVSTISSGDGVFCLNYRADRMRQIVRALTSDGFDGFDVADRPAVDLVTMTQYDETFDLPMAFKPDSMARFVAEVVSDAGRTMFRTAETEKYAHVTYFFNCGIEQPFPGEERQLVDSQKVATYDLMPEMSAPGITDVLCRAIEARSHDFILCNYANGDMVGHTGVFDAATRACTTVDQSLHRVLASAETAGATVMITADHGNCEMMVDPSSGGPHTAHTTNDVPFTLIGDDRTRSLRSGGKLADVGPTILNLLGIEIPSEMTGQDLREGV